MKKKITYAIIIATTLLFATENLCAQSTIRDSIARIGTADGKKTKLGLTERIKFKADRNNYNSDFFKPNPGLVSDTALLKDSVYVKAFRLAAYKKAYTRRTTGHYFLVGGLIYLAANIIVAFIIILSQFH